MRFLADMGLARSTTAFLRAQGHDAIHLRDEGLQRLKDQAIVLKVRQENRVILTHDLDFGRIIALSGADIPSVITFRLADMRPPRVNERRSEVISLFAEALERGALVSVSERGIRVRALPIDAQ